MWETEQMSDRHMRIVRWIEVKQVTVRDRKPRHRYSPCLGELVVNEASYGQKRTGMDAERKRLQSKVRRVMVDPGRGMQWIPAHHLMSEH